MVAVPFSEPPWLNGLPNAMYTESHRKWQTECRAFISKHMSKQVFEWEDEETVPPELFKTFAKANMLVPHLPSPLPVDELRAVGLGTLLGGLDVKDFDCIHHSIFAAEMSRCGLSSIGASMNAGYCFGIPPVLHYASDALKKRVLPDLLLGNTRTCIAITEPDAGSDVANIVTSAEKTKDGKHYIVNGAKKWITNGFIADWATMAVRTGGKGPKGLSLLLVPLKDTRGVMRRRIKVQGQRAGGTTYMELDDVQVPVENLIGDEGHGMQYVMTNFNHERMFIAIGATSQCRAALSLAFEYVLKREAFGKPLMDQPVVRHRLAKAGAELESLWAWIESLIFQLAHLPKKEADRELGGLTAACKARAGIVLTTCAETCSLLLGGNSYTRSGQGEMAEKMWREVMGLRIPGGSEDVMLDLSIRQLVKNYQQKVKELGSQSKL